MGAVITNLIALYRVAEAQIIKGAGKKRKHVISYVMHTGKFALDTLLFHTPKPQIVPPPSVSSLSHQIKISADSPEWICLAQC